MTLPRFIRRWLIARAIRRMIVEERNRQARMVEAEHFARRLFGPSVVVEPAEPVRMRVRAPAPAAVNREPGRQAIAMPDSAPGMFGERRPWSFPKPATPLRWEDCHRFAGAKPTREPWGLCGDTSPLSFVCVTCELEQPPIMTGERLCGYCGARYELRGTTLLWTRPDAPPPEPWTPRTP